MDTGGFHVSATVQSGPMESIHQKAFHIPLRKGKLGMAREKVEHKISCLTSNRTHKGSVYF